MRVTRCPVRASVEGMKRILIVEDDAVRERRIRSWLPAGWRAVVATSAGAAIGTLRLDRGRVYSAIALDHDLQARRASDRDLHLSGEDVAEAIASFVDPSVHVLIHSMNTARRGSMAEFLRQAGFAVEVIPISDLGPERLQSWLEESARETGDE